MAYQTILLSISYDILWRKIAYSKQGNFDFDISGGFLMVTSLSQHPNLNDTAPDLKFQNIATT